MRSNLYERRRKMLKKRGVGLSLVEVVKELSVEYDVSPRTLYYDWRNRKGWMETVLEIEDPEAFFLDLVASHRELRKFAILEYLKGDNSSARIGALRLLRDLNKDFHEMIVTQNLFTRVSKLEGKTMEQSGEIKNT